MARKGASAETENGHKIGELNNVSNDAKQTIETSIPYIARITIEGTAALLFHRWSVDGVKEKADAAKGSKAKKEDNIESYLWRNQNNEICLPGEYLRQSLIHASKFRQDPRSPRKSAMDLFKASIIALEDLCVIHNSKGEPFLEPEFVDRRRVQVQRNGITRHRPAIHPGYHVEVPIMVNLPEYVAPQTLHEVAVQAGKLIGLADFRPTFGRYSVIRFDLQQETA